MKRRTAIQAKLLFLAWSFGLLGACSPSLIGSLNRFSSGGLSISVTINATPGGTYAFDDTAPRTINFTHNGTSALCSHDGGATYGTCDSASTLIFTVADYTGSKVLKIKVSKSGFADTIYTITLPTDIAGLTFPPCDYVASVAQGFSTFAAGGGFALNTTGRVHCIAAGVTVTADATTTLTITQNNVSIIGYGSGATRGTIVGSSAGNNTIAYNNAQNLKLSNLIITDAPTGGNDMIYGSGAAGYVNIFGCSITNSGNGNPAAVAVNGSATASTITYSDITVAAPGGQDAVGVAVVAAGAVTIDHTTFTDTHPTANMGASVFSSLPTTSVITVTNSTFNNSSHDPVFQVTGGTLSVSSSTITTTSVDGEVFRLTSGDSALTFTLQSSTATGPGVVVKISSDAANAVNATIDQSTLATRGDNANPGGSRALRLDRTGAAALTLLLNRTVLKHLAAGSDSDAIETAGAGVPTINSTLDQNRICSVGTGSPWFTGTDDGGGWGGTFALANQLNGGVLHTCP